METTNNKQGGKALIPFLVFILISVGSGIILNMMGVERPFYQIPASVAVFVAIIVAFIIYKGSVEEKVSSFIKGCTNENIAIMYMTVFLAGAFSDVAKASGGVDSVVNLGLNAIPPAYLTLGLFVIAAFMSLATGSSSGTTAALGLIAFTMAGKAGLNTPMVLAAVLCGAFFGDNLSIISDTTIVATRTQGVEMKDKFRLNLLIALPAVVITMVLFFVFGTPDTVVAIEAGEFSLIKILPYIYVLGASIAGMNVFLVLGSGAFLAGIIGIATGSLTIITFAQAIYSGFAGMTEIVVLAIFIGGLSKMMSDQGGLIYLMNKVKTMIKSRKSAEVGIATLVSLADVSVANNTAALIVTADICKEISHEYKVDPRRTASLMDIFSTVAQGLLPYGNQILLIGALAGGAVAPVEIIPYMWYIILLGIFAIASVFVPYADKYIIENPWNWNKSNDESNKEQSKARKA